MITKIINEHRLLLDSLESALCYANNLHKITNDFFYDQNSLMSDKNGLKKDLENNLFHLEEILDLLKETKTKYQCLELKELQKPQQEKISNSNCYQIDSYLMEKSLSYIQEEIISVDLGNNISNIFGK